MDKLDELLTRGVDKIYPSLEELQEVLRGGKKLKLYQGFDPTGTKLHIGHMVGLRKLAQWQKLGHHVIFLIGDGTGQAGDPSGKTRSRDKFLTRDELRENAKDYIMQAKGLIDFDAPNVEILYNGDWLNSLKLPEILEIAGYFTWQQFSERDLFQERIKNKEPILLREAMYPLLQAYDSVAMDVDLELGGSDQTFNMLAGRSLMRSMKNKDKFVMTTPLLTDSKGNKIGKTEGNVIALNDQPEDLYKKIMFLGDDVIVKGLEYLTDISIEEIRGIEEGMKKGENPIQFKKLLAETVVATIHGATPSEEASEEFEKVVQKGENPSNPASFSLSDFPSSNPTASEVAIGTDTVSSKTEFKRLVDQGAVEIDGQKIKSHDLPFPVEKEEVMYKLGKKIIKIKK